MKREKTSYVARVRLLIAFAAIIATAGCASITSTSRRGLRSDRGNRCRSSVEDCAIVGISSPTQYACGGKVYTSSQLAKLRMDEEKKYAAGK